MGSDSCADFLLVSWKQSARTTSLECPLRMFSASFLISYLPPVMEFLLQYSGCHGKETGITHHWSSLALTHHALTHMGGITAGEFSFVLLCLGGGVALATSLYTLVCPHVYLFYAQMEYWNLFLGRLDFYSVSFLWVSAKSALSWYSPILAPGVVAIIQAPPGSAACAEVDLCAYYPVHIWVSLFPCVIAYGAGFCNSHRGAFAHG